MTLVVVWGKCSYIFEVVVFIKNVNLFLNTLLFLVHKFHRNFASTEHMTNSQIYIETINCYLTVYLVKIQNR